VTAGRKAVPEHDHGDAFALSLDLARAGTLYPAVILHGGSELSRRAGAEELARALLCDEAPAARPCGRCRHCRRVTLSGGAAAAFHPDLVVVERDLKTSTSVEGTKSALRTVQLRPFEARGQVVVVANAETLSGAAANALLKALEEPGLQAPRNFLLLAPSATQLLPTLRSRSLSIYLPAGGRRRESRAAAAPAVAALGAALDAYLERDAAAIAIGFAAVLFDHAGGAPAFEDLRAEAPWAKAAAAVLATAEGRPRPVAAPLYELAHGLLEAPDLRVRAVPARRILDGLTARALARLRLERGDPADAPA
jgi:DNA polymerase-3 subunit delta'